MGSSYPTARSQREVTGRHPAVLAVVHVEREAVDDEVALERRQLVERLVQLTSSRWWATVTCGWYGNWSSTESGPRRTEEAELLAGRDALGEHHEDHRGDRPEGAGARRWMRKVSTRPSLGQVPLEQHLAEAGPRPTTRSASTCAAPAPSGPCRRWCS